MSRNYAKIKKVFPDIGDMPEADDLQRLALKLDHAEEIESFMKGEAGASLREHTSQEIAYALMGLFKSTHDSNSMLALVERLRTLTQFYKMMSHSDDDAETLRNMVDDMIENM